MIFVVLGTWEMPFTRPLREIESAVRDGLLIPPVIVQSGSTAYSSSLLQMTPYFDKEELERMYDRAALVICQAGVGSIMLGLKRRKRLIAIARRRQYDEHIDDHQLEILSVFSQFGAVLAWKGEGDLPEVLQRTINFVANEYSFVTERISGAILDYLDGTIG